MERQSTFRKFKVLSTTEHALYNTIFGAHWNGPFKRDNFTKGIIGK